MKKKKQKKKNKFQQTIEINHFQFNKNDVVQPQLLAKKKKNQKSKTTTNY